MKAKYKLWRNYSTLIQKYARYRYLLRFQKIWCSAYSDDTLVSMIRGKQIFSTQNYASSIKKLYKWTGSKIERFNKISYRKKLETRMDAIKLQRKTTQKYYSNHQQLISVCCKRCWDRCLAGLNPIVLEPSDDVIFAMPFVPRSLQKPQT